MNGCVSPLNNNWLHRIVFYNLLCCGISFRCINLVHFILPLLLHHHQILQQQIVLAFIQATSRRDKGFPMRVKLIIGINQEIFRPLESIFDRT